MIKSYTQQQIEREREGRDIRDILLELLEQYRGNRRVTTKVAAALDVSDETIRNWCRSLEINLAEYL